MFNFFESKYSDTFNEVDVTMTIKMSTKNENLVKDKTLHSLLLIKKLHQLSNAIGASMFDALDALFGEEADNNLPNPDSDR